MFRHTLFRPLQVKSKIAQSFRPISHHRSCLPPLSSFPSHGSHLSSPTRPSLNPIAQQTRHYFFQALTHLPSEEQAKKEQRKSKEKMHLYFSSFSSQRLFFPIDVYTSRLPLTNHFKSGLHMWRSRPVMLFSEAKDQHHHPRISIASLRSYRVYKGNARES